MSDDKINKLFVLKCEDVLSYEEVKVLRSQLEYALPVDKVNVRFLILDKKFDLIEYDL